MLTIGDSDVRVVSEIRKQNIDGACFKKAQERNQMTFTLMEQDRTTAATIAYWILQNIETAPADKLRTALEECLEMRTFPARKFPD